MIPSYFVLSESGEKSICYISFLTFFPTCSPSTHFRIDNPKLLKFLEASLHENCRTATLLALHLAFVQKAESEKIAEQKRLTPGILSKRFQNTPLGNANRNLMERWPRKQVLYVKS